MPFLGGFSASLVHAQPNVFNIAVSKSLTTETITIAEASHVRLVGKTRPLATETITIAEVIAKLITKLRALSDTSIIDESVLRWRGKVRPLSDTTTIAIESIAKLIAKVREAGDAMPPPTSEALGNLIGKMRALAAQTITISEAIDKIVGVTGAAIEKTLSESQLISESSGRLKAVWRLQPP